MRKVLIIILSALYAAAPAKSQALGFFGFGNEMRVNEKPNRFVYGAEFNYYFDNREFDTGKNLYTGSMTINAARLTPLAGLEINEGKKLSHRIMLGIDVLKNMGESPVSSKDRSLENTGLFHEMLLYYKLKARAGNSLIKAYAGIFPRNSRIRDYGNEFLSDSLKFYDNNIEGVLIQMLRPNASFELGCDWLGMYGSGRRERFIIFSHGNARLTPWLSTGWYVSGYHLANMVEYGGVVDYFLAKPFVTTHFENFLLLQQLSLSLSWLQSLQRDRAKDKGFDFPSGAQAEFKIMNWGVGIENKLFIGTSLMPYYGNIDAGGNKYGPLLYRGDPFYRIKAKSGDWKEIGLYNRLEVFYRPRISDFLDLQVSFLFHFAENEAGNLGFIGSRQKFSLLFNLEKLKNSGDKTLFKASKNKRRKQGLASGEEYYL